ncbi:MAG: hypothetical protein U5R49_25250 [Deltaproteobacteria bacterium]|nr:hypothetical protein [Deltaproteobacteria bacterium]
MRCNLPPPENPGREKAAEARLARMLRKRIRIDEQRLHGAVFKIADRIEELAGACRLVYDAYVRKGYMDPAPSGMRVTEFTLSPHTTTFIGRQNGDIISTISLYGDSKAGLAMDAIYRNELDALREQGRKIAEVGSLAASPDNWNGKPDATFHMFKIMLNYAMGHLNLDDLVIAVNPRQKNFYVWALLFDEIGELKSYDYVKSNPAVAMRMPLEHCQARHHEVYTNRSPENNLHHFLFERQSPLIQLPDEKKPYTVMTPQKADQFCKRYGIGDNPGK